MKIKEIESRARARLGIDAFNAMQTAMAAQKLPGSILLEAPTGTGKTLAFIIAVLASVGAPGGAVQAVVVAPTRELCLQTFETLRTLAAPEYKTAVLYGGHPMEAEKASLAAGADIVVATPGRLNDHISRRSIDLSQVICMVLDEYDKSVDLGFLPQIRNICTACRRVRTLVLTSATSNTELPDFLPLKGLVRLDFTESSGAPESEVRTFVLKSEAPDKLESAADLLRQTQDGRTIVFVNHREAAERVAAGLRRAGFDVGLFHGALEQNAREKALILFRNGTTPVLVATDLAARGLDIDKVETVVHYHMPPTAESWTHRNGRTGRQGAPGRVVVIESDHDKVPEYVVTDSDWHNAPVLPAIHRSGWRTLYINAGRKDKISRGDVAGYLMKLGGLTRDEVGRIDIGDHSAFVAVKADKVRGLIESLRPHKLKNTKVKVSVVAG